jgi:hypothetical protein
MADKKTTAAETVAIESAPAEPAAMAAQDALSELATTIPGGAYIVAGQWVDANGKELSAEQIAEAKALVERHAQAKAALSAHLTASTPAGRPS